MKRLTAREKAILTLVAVVGALVAFYLLVHEPLLARLDQIGNEAEDSRTRLTQARALVKEQSKLEESLEQARKEVERLNRKIPGSEAQALFLYHLSQIEASSSVSVTSLKIMEPQDAQTFKEYPVELTVAGPYLGHVRFFQALEGLPQMVRVDKVAFKAGEGSTMSVPYLLRIFMDPTGNRLTSVPEFPAPGKENPFAAPSPPPVLKSGRKGR